MTLILHKFILLLVTLCLFSSPLYGSTEAAEESSDGEAFCNSCHEKQAAAIAGEGLAHQAELTCRHCHHGHKPKSFDNIPACHLCHEGKTHYNQLQCLNCHRDPHRPMQIKLPKKAHAECMACHHPQGLDLAQDQSYHSQLVCTDCHAEHRFMPECMSCHKSHASEITEQDCQTCHAPHKPLEILFSSTETPTEFCTPCHAEAALLLTASRRRHRELKCLECHAQHGSVPACRSCHGEPHAEAMHVKFPECNSCHISAHNLN